MEKKKPVRHPADAHKAGTKGRRRSSVQIFLSGFLRSFLFLLLLAGIGIASYQITYRLYDSGTVTYDGEESMFFQKEGKKEHQQVCRNLIYEVDAGTGRIKAVVLEIFDTGNKKLTYLTIPKELAFELSNELFRKVCTITDKVPQKMVLGRLTKYFEGTSSYEYGEVFLGDWLDTEITYYTAMGEKAFHKIFKKDADGTYVFCPSMWKRIGRFSSEEDRKAYMTKMYSKISTDCNLASRLAYAGDYEGMNEGDISFERLFGEMSENIFYADKAAACAKLSDIENGEPFR